MVFFIKNKKVFMKKNEGLKMNMHLHYDGSLPGGVSCPSVIEVVERKISLVQQLQFLCESLPIGVVTNPKRNIKNLIEIELQAIYDMVSMDK